MMKAQSSNHMQMNEIGNKRNNIFRIEAIPENYSWFGHEAKENFNSFLTEIIQGIMCSAGQQSWAVSPHTCDKEITDKMNNQNNLR